MRQSCRRRDFLKSTLAAAAGLAALPARGRGRVFGANDDLRVACVGLNGQGQTHMYGFAEMDGVRVVGLCDADRGVLDTRARQFNEWLATKAAERVRRRHAAPMLAHDLRKLLDSKEIDLVTIATPNHWHSLMTIWACQAGKDVYVEKPVSHNVWEGRQAVAAAEKYARIVQTGTQSRSAIGVREAIGFVHGGTLGRVLVSRGFCYKRRPSIGKMAGEQAIPAGVDYDLWTGPAGLLPLRRKSLHYDWHWDWNTGNGDIGNQGIHQMDIARWALGVDRLSDAVLSVGGRFGYIDDGQTPNTQVAIHRFKETSRAGSRASAESSAQSAEGSNGQPPPEPGLAGDGDGRAPSQIGERRQERGDSTYAGLLIFEVRGLETESYRGAAIGNIIECERGYVLLDTDGGAAFNPDGSEIRRFEARGDAGRVHRQNFLDAVRSRRTADLHADVRQGHLSSALCHTSNISHRLGASASQAEARRTAAAFGPAGEDAVERMGRHLAARFSDFVAQFGPQVALPQIDAAAVQLVAGKRLSMNVATEHFEDAAANALATREYRAPYVVPAIT